MAFAYDGAWAKYHVSKAMGLTRVPDGVPLQQAAILADAVSTPYAAVVRTAQVHLGNAVGVWGVGGVGSHLVQLAKLAGGVPIIAVDIDDAVLARATRLGADYTFRSDDPQLGRKIKEATGGRMLDVAFDAVGIPETIRQSVAWLDTGGRAVSVGMSGENIDARPDPRLQPAPKAAARAPGLQDAGHRDAGRDAAVRPPRPLRIHQRGGAVERGPRRHLGASRAPGQPDPHPGPAVTAAGARGLTRCSPARRRAWRAGAPGFGRMGGRRPDAGEGL
jgi:hypothetical protein